MKKVLNNSKLSTPSKFVRDLRRRVLSRTSNESRTSQVENNQPQASTSGTMKTTPDSAALELELTSLREQLSILQFAITNMQEDGEKKEKALANLAREKQQLSTDLRREKRSSTSLKQQLEDEREFYYKEKEQYCQEMNDCKKLKKKFSETTVNKKRVVTKEESSEILECKNQVSKLKAALNQTLEANYNLSVKFLRMKNTKINLKNRLKKQQSDHEQAMQSLQFKINSIKNEIADVVDKRFMLPISPSNKRYLQIIKQNGMLMHENLCLQMEVERLSRELEYVKATHLYQSTSNKLKYSHNDLQQKDGVKPSHSKPTSIISEKELDAKVKTKSIRHLQKAGSSKSTVKQVPSAVSYQGSKDQNNLKNDKSTEIIKIFEREEVKGIPEIIMLPLSNKQDIAVLQETNKQTVATDNTELQTFSMKNSQKTSFTQISENPSQMGMDLSDFTHTTSSREAVRTQSAPEIVQTSLFVSILKP